ncbi:MAG: hypothetical protein ACK2UK_08485 [Candidatus Promineifilaceae bacterium]
MRALFICLLVTLSAVACGPSAEQIALAVAETRAAEPTTTPIEITVIHTAVADVPVTVQVTQEVEVTRLVEKPVTVTFTATPLNSPTPSSTPTASPTPTATSVPTDTPIPSDTPPPTATFTPTPSPVPSATPDMAATETVQAYGALAEPKGSGFYTVGTEILPGKWRSTGTGDDCYWARLDAAQDLLDNHFGYAGGTVNVQPADYEVQFDGCGTWIYVENEQQVIAADAQAPKGDGFYTVGVEIAPGRWTSTGSGDSCYWARLTGSQDLLDNHYGLAGGTMTIAAGDYEVQLDGCGTWEYLGP